MELIPIKKAIGIIIGITIVVTGTAALGLGFFKYIQSERVNDPKYDISAIVQISPEKEPLKTVYLSELINLSIDQPTNIYRFNVENAEQQLLLSPLIKRAKIKKNYPGIVYIHYVSRIPIAFLADYTNTAIDKDGVPIPFKPFFTPKILPEIYLGLEEEVKEDFLGKPMNNKRVTLALKLLNHLSTHLVSDNCLLKRIDVSQSFAPSYGQKQIVVIMEDNIEKLKNGLSLMSKHTRILRLSSTGYEHELENYLTLRKYLLEKESAENQSKLGSSKVIDLRIPQLAFIKKVS